MSDPHSGWGHTFKKPEPPKPEKPKKQPKPEPTPEGGE